MRVLLTGGTGFFGKSILDQAQRGGPRWTELVILARHPDMFQAACPALSSIRGVTFVRGDVRTVAFPGGPFDVVIHAAAPARTDVPDGEMRSIILDGTRHTLEFAKKCGCRKFMFISSGAVYGKGFHSPIPEDAEPHPITAYGKAKLEAERMCVASGLPVLLPRCFAFVGPYLPRDAHFAIGNFIRDCLVNKPIIIKGDGTPVRSYLYADDLVEWLWTILVKGQSGRSYNVGADQGVSIRDLAETVKRVTGSSSAIQVLGQPVPGAADYYVPEVRRCKIDLGCQIKTSLHQAILSSLEAIT